MMTVVDVTLYALVANDRVVDTAMVSELCIRGQLCYWIEVRDLLP